MAKSYTTTGSFQTVKVLSQNQVLDVEAVGIQTKPTGIRLTVPVPYAAYQAGNEDQFLGIVADLIESLVAAEPDAGQQLVTGGAGSQLVDASGLLAYYVNLTVSYTPLTTNQGTFSANVTLPVAVFETAAAFDADYNGKPPLVWITDTYAQLKKTANA